MEIFLDKKAVNTQHHVIDPYEDEHLHVHFIGDTFSNTLELGEHCDPGYEICLVPYGKGLYKIDNTTYSLQQNQLSITRAGQCHAFYPAKENPFRLLYLCFSFKNSAQHGLWSEIDRQLNAIEMPICIEAFQMKPLHERILLELTEDFAFRDALISNLIKQFILYAVRNLCQREPAHIKLPQTSAPRFVTEKIIDYLNQNRRDSVTLEELGNALNYSIPYLCACFKEQTGFTVMEYLTLTRLEAAKTYLTQTAVSISEIALEIGFKSLHHFSRLFKAYYSYSPSQYRSLFAEKDNSV